MIVTLYSLLDRKLREFGAVHVERNDDAFLRSFKDAVVNGESMVKKYPEDFDIYVVGIMDTETGSVEGELRLLENAGDVLKASEPVGV